MDARALKSFPRSRLHASLDVWPMERHRVCLVLYCSPPCPGGEQYNTKQTLLFVRVFRGNKFSVREGKGNFRAYLAKMIRSQLYMAYRRETARGLGLNVPLDDAELVVPADSVTAAMDVEWMAARHRAAVEHVLTKTLVSDLNKRLYRAYVVEERPIDEVAREFGVTRNQVSQAKTRIGRMVAAIEEDV